MELLDWAGKPRAFKKKLASVSRGENVVFDHIAPPAYSFVCGLICAEIGKSRLGANIWILTKDLRDQENVFAGLANWWGEVSFLPQHEIQNDFDAVLDPDISAERLGILHALSRPSSKHESRAIVLVRESLDEDVALPKLLSENKITLFRGLVIGIEELTDKLDNAGYERSAQVAERGHYAVRGGIVDIFSWQTDRPVRAEFFDDEVESLRTFDIDAQTSLDRIESCEIILRLAENKTEFCKLRDYVEENDVIVSVEWELCDFSKVHITSTSFGLDEEEDYSTACFDSPVGGYEAGDFILQEAKRSTFMKQLTEWQREKWRVCMFFTTQGEVERFAEVLDQEGALGELVEKHIGNVMTGFTVLAAKLVILSEAEIFGRYQHARTRRLFNKERRVKTLRSEANLRDFNRGDYVVHTDYGIGKFKGLGKKENKAGVEEDVLILEYANDSRLYVPLQHAHLVSRYVGAGRSAPKLNRLGDGKWNRTKKAAERSIMDYAAQLLSTQAERQSAKAFCHEADGKWQWEFENSFIYKETPDQLRAIDETKQDMESERPMDRLICGDVGFGKTEVAIRAAFKSVMSGRQVAILVPTTVLAQQHFQTFRERMSGYPVTIELLSRYRTPKQQREVIKQLVTGSVDIVIGTHRLISKDVVFKNLGLVVIDEEQRFGVKHKERFKEMFHLVDVLTLSATPIPRTLYQALMGARDMSTIDTPPPNRYPVHTTVCPYDEKLVRRAIERELARGGQIYYLHNRVLSIEQTCQHLAELCPKAKIEFGHGQMEENQLEGIMQRFIEGGIDVLVCTTIIESGVDIPNANTIIIDRADRFGLADLYQLRGRVGRTGVKAYAILMLPPGLITVGDARKRINAIKQYSSLGSGFKIAMRDLEIRGAGNLLGIQQSGHIVAVGFDLYCQLLKQSVAKLTGQHVGQRADVAIHIDFICNSEAEFQQSPSGRIPAFIPERFMPDAGLRIAGYRMLAEATTQKELKSIIRNWRDRFGKFPPAVDNILRCCELRVAAARSKISAVEIEQSKLKLSRNGQFILLSGKFPRLKDSFDNSAKLREAVKLVKEL